MNLRNAWPYAARLIATIPTGSRVCVVCGNRVGAFLPYRGGWRAAPALVRALELVGSDLDNFGCPRCGSHDRERHLFLYMERAGIFSAVTGKVVIHFAPEKHLARRIEAAGPSAYFKCDLLPNSPEIQEEDMLSMSFPDASADLLIANHVLEHVPNLAPALGEIARVLRPGGLAILQTPFSPVLARTWEDEGVTSRQARLEAYGQEDHVRLFGRDIFRRFEQCGLSSRVRSHAELLPEIDPAFYAVNPREPFFLFERSI